MTRPELRGLRELAVTLGIGAFGAGLFWLVGFPVAALTGSAVAVSAAGIAGVRLRVPDWLRNLTFLTLGINIGSSVTPELLATAAAWPGSFVILSVTLIAALYTSRTMLERGFGYDRPTAILSSTPGHLSYVLGLAADGRYDIVTISIAQSTRVLVLTVCVPPVIALLFGATGIDMLPATVVSIPHGIGLYAVSALLGYAFVRLRVPAAYLLAAMAISAAGHLSELAPGRMPTGLITGALVVMGALIGTRFRGTSVAKFRAAVLAGLAVTAVMLVFAILGSVAVMALLGLPLATMIVAFAPGGVEAMAAIALQLGLDPAFVAGHHIFRLVLLTFLVPMLMHQGRAPP